MDILDRLLGHDAWTTRQLLLQCREFDDEQLDRKFAIGPGSLRVTFDHIIWNIEAWTDAMQGRALRAKPRGSDNTSITGLIARLDAATEEFASMARKIQSENRLDDRFTGDAGPPLIQHTFGGGIVHVVTHSMHHRAQILNMMRQLGIKGLIEGDVMSWEAAQRPSG